MCTSNCFLKFHNLEHTHQKGGITYGRFHHFLHTVVKVCAHISVYQLLTQFSSTVTNMVCVSLNTAFFLHSIMTTLPNGSTQQLGGMAGGGGRGGRGGVLLLISNSHTETILTKKKSSLGLGAGILAAAAGIWHRAARLRGPPAAAYNRFIHHFLFVYRKCIQQQHSCLRCTTCTVDRCTQPYSLRKLGSQSFSIYIFFPSMSIYMATSQKVCVVPKKFLMKSTCCVVEAEISIHSRLF